MSNMDRKTAPSKKAEHWCSECAYYRGDTSVGELCDLTGRQTYDSRPDDSYSCDRWTACIQGPMTWEDVKTVVETADKMASEVGCTPQALIKKYPTEKAYYTEVISRYNKLKEGE